MWCEMRDVHEMHAIFENRNVFEIWHKFGNPASCSYVRQSKCGRRVNCRRRRGRLVSARRARRARCNCKLRRRANCRRSSERLAVVRLRSATLALPAICNSNPSRITIARHRCERLVWPERCSRKPRSASAWRRSERLVRPARCSSRQRSISARRRCERLVTMRHAWRASHNCKLWRRASCNTSPANFSASRVRCATSLLCPRPVRTNPLFRNDMAWAHRWTWPRVP
mmetsp:Transcript_64018/g.169522  ORF Transcript_64018/g.169522 Transcript_64018/m.169522 type:complete len:227 (+) Transcript_64018:320-1000(+)